MNESEETITVNVNVVMTRASLQAIVENARKVEGCDEKGVYRINTADRVSEMISNFILENDFESYAKKIENYPRRS